MGRWMHGWMDGWPVSHPISLGISGSNKVRQVSVFLSCRTSQVLYILTDIMNTQDRERAAEFLLLLCSQDALRDASAALSHEGQKDAYRAQLVQPVHRE